MDDGGEVRTAVAPEGGRSLLAAGMIGLGVMAAVDEIVFHQLLDWHHFYDAPPGGWPCCPMASCMRPS